MADGVDEDDEDEDGGDEEAAALPAGGLGQLAGLAPDGRVDQAVEHDDRAEGDDVNHHRDSRRNLRVQIGFLLLLLQNTVFDTSLTQYYLHSTGEVQSISKSYTRLLEFVLVEFCD